jgi:hypothetical protein
VFRLKLTEINIIHSGSLKLSPWVVLTKHICKKTSRHSSICAPMKPSYINTRTSSYVNLGSEEQLTIMCSSLNECISFAVRVFYLVFLHVQKWKTMLHLHVTNTTNNIAWTWYRYPSKVRFHQTRVTWSRNTADSARVQYIGQRVRPVIMLRNEVEPIKKNRNCTVHLYWAYTALKPLMA